MLCNEIHSIPNILTFQSATISVFNLTTTVTHSLVHRIFLEVVLNQVLHSYSKPVDYIPMGKLLVEEFAPQLLRTYTQPKCRTVKFDVTNLAEGNAWSIIHENGTDAPLELIPRFTGELAVNRYCVLTQIAAPRFWCTHHNIFSCKWSRCRSEYCWLYIVRLFLVHQRT